MKIAIRHQNGVCGQNSQRVSRRRASTLWQLCVGGFGGRVKPQLDFKTLAKSHSAFRADALVHFGNYVWGALGGG